MAVKGTSLAMVAVGGIFVWSGLFNKKITQTIQDLVRGTKPVPGPGMILAPGSIPAATVTGPNPQGNAIAADVQQYVGRVTYCFGGAMNGPSLGCPAGTVDCSSLCNLVIGHDLGMTIPGFPNGSYTGVGHGPGTLVWLASIGTVTTRIPRSELAPGDIACWQSHMGIAISNTEMVSAQTPSSGVQVGTIDNFMPGEILVCLRLKQVAAGPVTKLRHK